MKEELDNLIEVITDRLEDEFMSKYDSWNKVLSYLNTKLSIDASEESISIKEEDLWTYNSMCAEALDVSKKLYTLLYKTSSYLNKDDFMDRVINSMLKSKIKSLKSS